MDGCGLSRALASAIARVARARGADIVVLFGSRARGEARENSDIDIAVAGVDAEDLRYALDCEVATLKTFDVVSFDDVRGDLAREIERDGVVLYEKDR